MDKWINISIKDRIWQVEAIIHEHHTSMHAYRDGERLNSICLTRKEALNFACLLPEVQALFQWAKDAREQVDEGYLFLLEAVADEIFEPFERSQK